VAVAALALVLGDGAYVAARGKPTFKIPHHA
jgi:hypothetical protein